MSGIFLGQRTSRVERYILRTSCGVHPASDSHPAMSTHVAAQYLNTTVAARDSLTGFPYIDFGDSRVSQSAAFSRLSAP